MPRKLSDRAKIAKGTFRKDREAAPKAIVDAQAAVAVAVKELEAAKRKAKGAKLTARQRTLAEDKVRVLNDSLELALEDMAKARAVPIAPSIRPGLELMSYDEVMNAQPPLSDAEELEWPGVSGSEEDLIQRRRAAAVPLTVKDAELIRSILSHMEYLAGQRNLTATEAARLKLFREHLAYFEAQQG
jgi:hypothetical protein